MQCTGSIALPYKAASRANICITQKKLPLGDLKALRIRLETLHVLKHSPRFFYGHHPPSPELLRRIELEAFTGALEAKGGSIRPADIGCAVRDVFLLEEQVLQQIPAQDVSSTRT